jgi:hypothetical protein
MKKNFKCAVAFFFLFFIHGTSIGNGQQGISYNYHIRATTYRIHNKLTNNALCFNFTIFAPFS